MEPVIPYDLAAIVDPEGLGEGGAGDIDGGEAAATIEEAMSPEGIVPYDLAAIVDPGGLGIGGAGNIDVGEAAAAKEEAMRQLQTPV